MPGNSFGDCTIADSAAELGETQGDQGWFYGYYRPDSDDDGSFQQATDFVEMEHCDDGAWRPSEVCGLDRDDPAFRWTQNLAWGLQHPETEPELELPIRRWVSDTSGPATLTLEHHVGGTASDGTRAILVIDDREAWRNDAQGGDEVGTTDSMQVELAVGMVFDQLVHPLGNSADDTTYFTIRLEGL